MSSANTDDSVHKSSSPMSSTGCEGDTHTVLQLDFLIFFSRAGSSNSKLSPSGIMTCFPNVQARGRQSIPSRAEKSPGSQEQATAPSQDQAQDPEDKLWEEIEREDQQAAELTSGKTPVFDLFPPPPPRLTAQEQKQRAYKLSRRPLRATQHLRRAQTSRKQKSGQPTATSPGKSASR